MLYRVAAGADAFTAVPRVSRTHHRPLTVVSHEIRTRILAANVCPREASDS